MIIEYSDLGAQMSKHENKRDTNYPCKCAKKYVRVSCLHVKLTGGSKLSLEASLVTHVLHGPVMSQSRELKE